MMSDGIHAVIPDQRTKSAALNDLDVQYSVPLHRGDDAGVVHILSLHAESGDKILADAKDRPVDAQRRESLDRFGHHPVDAAGIQSQPVDFGRLRRRSLILIADPRDEHECVSTVVEGISCRDSFSAMGGGGIIKTQEDVRVQQDSYSPRPASNRSG